LVAQPPPAPSTYTCKNCPQSPQFLSKDALIRHWQDTHTVSMVETISNITILGQNVQLQAPIVAKHVEGPDV